MMHNLLLLDSFVPCYFQNPVIFTTLMPPVKSQH